MKYYNESEFQGAVEQATGLKIGVDYGFIMGSMSPYSSRGMQSSSNSEGWEIWKKNKDGSFSTARIDRPVNDSLQTTLDFLKDDVEFYKRSLTGYYNRK